LGLGDEKDRQNGKFWWEHHANLTRISEALMGKIKVTHERDWKTNWRLKKWSIC
jgi:hypothetical protein